MRLLLFDIDGTLLLGGGVGMRSFSRAFAERFGIDDSFADIRPHGKTDPLILREILISRRLVQPGDREGEDRAVRELTRLYEGYLEQEMRRATCARLLPGVVSLLEALQQQDGVLLGLLTGNFERTARIKLQHFDLNRFFPFGAFASDAEQRPRLVPIAVVRAEAQCGRRLGLGRHVALIGDTPLDVDGALANEVTAVGVASHGHSQRQLRAAGAHLTLPDLADTEQVVAQLLQVTQGGVCS